MNETAKGTTMYEAIPVVSELNRVAGFDPLKFARRATQPGKQETQLKLDLKYKKLWFRLKYPQGRLKVTPLRITEQIAIFEAKVYFDKKDTEPVSSCISTRTRQETPGGLYIEYAQRNATEQALDDAGFGLQLVNLPDGQIKEAPAAVDTTPKVPVPAAGQDVTPPPAPAAPVVENNHVEEIAEVPPAAETAAKMVNKEPAVRQEAAADVVSEVPAAENQPDHLEEVEAASEEEAAQENEQDEDGEPVEAPPYTPDMPVDEILAKMTLDEARNIIVDTGTCKGWPLSQVAERRAASLRYYLNGYQGSNNILRAGAKLLAEELGIMDIAS